MLEEILLLLRTSLHLAVSVDDLRAGKGQPALFLDDQDKLRKAIAKVQRLIGEEEVIADGRN